MPEPPIFLDTSGILALFVRRDALHARASAIHRQLTAQAKRMITTQWVLAELLGFASRVAMRRAAAQFVRRILTSARVQVVPAAATQWQAAFELFQSRPDKEWSLVDCSSILICQDRGIQEVLTADRHFEQAGLRILLDAGD